MKLDKVQIQHFRNLQNVDILPSPSLNFIFGQNGSGKSSFLEALHYLGFGRSFRTLKHKNVIQYNSIEFSIFSVVSDENNSLKLGMSRKNDDSLLVSVNGNKSNKMSELVSHVPIQIFTPQSSDLIIGSPSLRRRFLDWGLFHVEPSFIQTSQEYQKLVKQKNALLRKNTVTNRYEYSTQMQFWDKQIIKVGNHLTELRKAYLDSILAHINSNLLQFLPEFSVEISYHRGWEKDASFEESINKKYERDCRNGYLSVGPHKADLKLKCNGVDVSETLSRGQLRMLVAALQLAQIQHLSGQTKKSCVFLLDDIGAELDETKRESFIDKLLENETQLFITAIEKSQLLFIEKYKNKKMFHVEHGHMREEN
ncbi:DNA replication/repair protein RecF [Aliiglaciecola sp. 3_MG-2023]|uniref:DNA replication/repair protein RecF n=1 Tax=Aliiglaciecola sp. 3_MG-2023 TaxID=3062644 RepID=UPI0026E49460|nr:DNA replication/repair protein RecF [Aliiglaciecola sp. 3_MG-2023]MDO6695616.1 DNA replication/repair protein RecF [Aliiglaciecola sp. 3_MG-2023]